MNRHDTQPRRRGLSVSSVWDFSWRFLRRRRRGGRAFGRVPGQASVLPGEASAAGKGPDGIVEIVLPGRVYEPPIKVIPVKTKGDANRKTPEQASASDFSAFRRS
jgi:hypothetical protein